MRSPHNATVHAEIEVTYAVRHSTVLSPTTKVSTRRSPRLTVDTGMWTAVPWARFKVKLLRTKAG